MLHQRNQTNTLQECFIKEVVLMDQTCHRFSFHQDYQYIALFFYDIDYAMRVVVLLQSRFFKQSRFNLYQVLKIKVIEIEYDLSAF